MLSTQHIQWLWMQMTAIYGQLFISKHGDKDCGVWMEALQDLTPKAMESGVMRLKQLKGTKVFIDFPPNCLQFKALCLAFYEELNLPKASEAYREIKNRYYTSSACWSHKVVKYIAFNLPQDFLLIEQEQQAYAIFKKLYEEIYDLVRQGHEVPEVSEPKFLTHQPSREVGRQHLKFMMQRLRGCDSKGAVENSIDMMHIHKNNKDALRRGDVSPG